MGAFDLDELVPRDAAWTSPRIFSDRDVFDAELERVFGRSWLFLGHESQAEAPGDFFLSRMGTESVIVTRANDGRLHAHLNVCRHRGMELCRADHGNAATFRCPYHRWVYGSDGRLLGVPGIATWYFNELDKAEWGLISVAQIDTYKGLVFATFDPDAPSLADELGEMAWYLDCLLDRSPAGTEAVGGVQKWIVDCNWKFPVEQQIGDNYHVAPTHASITKATIGFTPTQIDELMVDPHEFHPAPGTGLGAELLSPDALDHERMAGTLLHWGRPELARYLQEVDPSVRERLGPHRSRLRIIHAGVFPNLSLVPLFWTVRVTHPISPGRSEIWSWVIVERDAPEEAKQAIRQTYVLSFGPGGIFEQDDGEMWEHITRGAEGPQARKHPLNLSMGLGHDGDVAGFPGTAGVGATELNQRGYYRRWRETMAVGLDREVPVMVGAAP